MSSVTPAPTVPPTATTPAPTTTSPTTSVNTVPSTSSASTSSAPSSSSSSVPSSSSTVSSISSTTLISSVSSTQSTTSQTTSTTISTTSLSSLLTTPTTSNTSTWSISRIVSTRSDGGVVTITTFVDPENTSTSSSSNNNSGENLGFFQNKAAMAATFTVAGLAAAVCAFLLITTCIRRRRAMKFDRDVAAAAAAAAAESHAIQPFDDDDDDVFTGAPRAQGGGYGYAPGKLTENDPYAFAAAGVVGGGPGGFGPTAQPMRQQQTAAPLAYPTAQQYPVQLYDQPYNGGGFGRQLGQQEAYNMQDLGVPADMPRRPGSAGTGHDTLPGLAGVGTQGSTSSPGPGPGRNSGLSALVGAAGLAGSIGAAAAFRNLHDDPYSGYVATPVGESRYPQPRWSQQQVPQPTPEQQQSGWYQQHGQQPVQHDPSPPPSTSTHAPAPAYSPGPGGLTAQGYPNEKSTYSNAFSATGAQTSSNEGPSISEHTAVSTNVPGTPVDEDDVGSVLEGHDGQRVLKVTNE